MAAKPTTPPDERPLPAVRPSDAEVWAADLELDSGSDMPARSDREERIRQAAYLAAERRGFAPGHELEDWLAAEQEIGKSD